MNRLAGFASVTMADTPVEPGARGGPTSAHPAPRGMSSRAEAAVAQVDGGRWTVDGAGRRRSRWPRGLSAAVLAAWFGAGCGEPPDPPAGPGTSTETTPSPATTDTGTRETPDPTTPTEPGAPTIAFAEKVPQVVWVDWDGEGAEVRWASGDHTGSATGDPPVALVGLKAGRTYRIAVGERPVVDVDVPVAPGLALPMLTVATAGAEMSTGVLLTAHYDSAADLSFVSMVDGDGDVVWSAPHTDRRHKATRARLARDGAGVLWSTNAWGRQLDIGRIERLSLDGSLHVVTPAVEQHHDFWEHADGTVAWLAWDVRDTDLTPGLAATAIHRAPEGSGDGWRLFSMHDHYPHAPWWGCSHMAPDQFRDGVTEWSHANSLVYDDATDAYWVMSRFLDAVWRIDAETGEVAWQLGGLHDDFEAEPGTLPFDHAHFGQRWEDRLLVFDNRSHAPGDPSRVVEYVVDEDGRTWAEVWSVAHPDGRKTGFQGDAMRLPGGNTLVSWGPNGLITEHAPDGTVVWRIDWDQTTTKLDFLPTGPPG